MADKPLMLIVDNESMGRTLALILEEKGCIMDAAETGEEATRKSMENFYNLALIGIGLLDMEKTGCGIHKMMNLEERDEQANKIISEVAEEVMLNIFGRKALDNILRAMREKYFLDLEEMPERPEVFSEALHRIIGLGSVIIEDLIVENLYAKMGLEFRWKKSYTFPDYIKEIRKFLLNKAQSQTTKILL